MAMSLTLRRAARLKASNSIRALSLRFGARVVAAVLQAATLILLARQLEPSVFGVFGQTQSIGIVLAAGLGLGLGVQALRIGDQPSSARDLSAMFILRLVGAGVAAAVLMGIFSGSGPHEHLLVAAAAAQVAADMVNDLSQNILAGQQEHKLASGLIVLHRLAPLLAVLLVPVPSLTIAGNYLAGALTSLAAACIYPLVRFSRPSSLTAVVRRSLWYSASTLVGPLSQFDTSIVRLVSAASSVGFYAIGARIGAPLNLLASSLVAIYVPVMTRQDEAARVRTFRRLRAACLLLAALLMISSPLIAAVVVKALGPSYGPSQWLLVGLICAAAISGVNQSYQALVYASDRPGVGACAVGIGTVIGLAALLVGGVLFGLAGLSVAAAFGQVAMLGLFHVLASRARLLGEAQ